VFQDDLGCAATEAAFVPRAPTLLIEQGVAIKAVQATPGHSTIATTMDVYSHVTPAMQDSVAEATDRLFAEPR
jgi:integrase